MSFRLKEKSTLYPAVAPYKEEITALRGTLPEIPEPHTEDELRAFTKLVTRNGKIISIVASLDDGNYVKQDIGRLNQFMMSGDEVLREDELTECREIARSLIVGIGIPLEKKFAAKSCARQPKYVLPVWGGGVPQPSAA